VGTKVRLQSFYFSFADGDVAGRGGFVPSLLSTRMWGEYYSSHFLSLFVWEDRYWAQRCARNSSIFLSLTVTWQAGEGRGNTENADNNTNSCSYRCGQQQHLRQRQHQRLAAPPPPSTTTHHHLPPLHHPPTRAYAYAHLQGWLLFSMTTTTMTFHHPPTRGVRVVGTGCCLSRPTTIFHHPLMRAYAYARFQGWLLPLPTPSTLQCECMHTLVFEGGA